jgi:hypothetical protein
MIQPWWGEAGGSRRRDGRDIKRPEVNVIDTGMVQKKNIRMVENVKHVSVA